MFPWKSRPKKGAYTEVDTSARISPDVRIGSWTKIEAGVRIGRGTHLGDWTSIGEGSVIGKDVHFGPWAKIGRNVILGDGVRLGSHTIVQDGAHVPEGSVFGDSDLVTPKGVIANRTGGYTMGLSGDEFEISGSFGRFRIPVLSRSTLNDHEIEDLHRIFRKKIDDFQWGRSDALEAFRIERQSEPAADSEADPFPSF